MSNDIKVKRFPNVAASYQAKVLAAFPCECPWLEKTSDPNAYNIALALETVDGQFCDYWQAEISNAPGPGQMQDRTKWQLALEQLDKVGWKNATNFSQAALQTMVGQTITISTSQNKNKDLPYINLGEQGFKPPVQLDAATLAAKQAAMFGGAAPVQGQQQAPQGQSQSAGNPFAPDPLA